MSNRKQNWSNYWKQGLIDSCASNVKSKDSEISNYWKSVAETIESDDVVVDLCTGAGAVIKDLISAKEQEIKSVSYIGVELSSYNGQKDNFLNNIKNQNIKLLNNTSIDNTGLKDNSVDMLVSQFGVEYALSDKFYKEIDRLLKKDGTIDFVLHHRNSVLSRVAEQEISHYQLVMEEVDIFSTVKELIPFFAMLKNPANAAKLNNDPKALKIREKFNGALNTIKTAANQARHPDLLMDILDSSMACLNMAKTNNKKVAFQFLEHLEQQLNDSFYRSKELLEAAMTESAVKDMASKISEQFENSHEIKELYSRNEIVGWALSLKRLC